MNLSKRYRTICNGSLLLLLVLLATLLLPDTAHAQDKEKIVRVGWFESQFNITDELGRRSGYAYDYQQRIAAYTGWTYEYVEGSWPELLQMLQDGKIDLLSDVSYTDERAQHMLYSSLPMGAEAYYLYATSSNQSVTVEDYSTFNGKKVGANKGSVQIDLFNEWTKANDVQAELVELTGSEEDNLAELAHGNIDLYLSLDGYFEKDSAVPVCKVGSSDFFFAVSKSRPKLLTELNNAMRRIEDENQYYNQQLNAKYLQNSNIRNYLNSKEKEWLETHGAIRVAYQDNYLPFCAKDPNTGKLTGALKECLAAASECVENAHLKFEPICYPTAAAAMEALEAGEADCAFPANLTDYDGETLGMYITPALMSTDVSAIIREPDHKNFANKDRVTVSVDTDNPNYDMFLQDHFPEWRAIYFADTQECLKAVSDGQADCFLISNYRYNNLAATCEKYRLTRWSTDVEMDFCIATNRQDTVLYSILSKVTGAIPSSTVNAALTYSFAEDTKTGLAESLNQSVLIFVAIVVVAVALVTLLLLWRGGRAGKRREQDQQPIPTKEDFALFDDIPLSYSVYRVIHAEHSKLYDAEIIYANRMFERYGGLPAEAVLGHRVRELLPYVDEEWYQNARRAAEDGETIELDYTDPLSKKSFHYKAWQVVCPGYCAVTYAEI